MAAQDAYIQSHQREIISLETQISGYREGLNCYKSKRDELHDKRKYTYAPWSFGFCRSLI